MKGNAYKNHSNPCRTSYSEARVMRLRPETAPAASSCSGAFEPDSGGFWFRGLGV